MTFFANNTDFQKYCNVNTGFELTNVENDFTAAFNRFVVPYLTLAQYNASVALPNNTTHAELIRLVKIAVANLGMMLYYPVLKVQITSAGLQNAIAKEKQLTQADKQDLFNHLQDKGYDAIEQMLAYLEANKSTFTAWANSNAYTEINGFFLRNATEFDAVLNINASRRFYQSIKGMVQITERTLIKPAMPTEVYNELRTAFLANTLSEVQAELLNYYVRPALAYLTIGKSKFSVADQQMYNYGVAILDADYVTKTKADAFSGYIIYHRQSCKAEGEAILEKMSTFIADNAPALGIDVPEADLTTFPYIRNEADWGTAFF